MAGLLDAIGGLADTASDFIGGLSDSWGFDVENVIQGAVTNAVIAGTSGGDVAKSALWGGFGSAVSDSGLFGEWSNEVGGAMQGFGVDKSLGGDGWMGAAGGALLQNMQDDDGGLLGGSKSKTPDLQQPETVEPEVPEEMLTKIKGSTPDAAAKIIQDNNLVGSDGSGMDRIAKMLVGKDGDSTALTKILMGAGKGWTQREATKDMMEMREKAAERESQRRRDDDDYDREAELQNRVKKIGRISKRDLA